MSKTKHRRADPTGRTRRAGRFVHCDYDMVTCPAFRSLSGAALKYYMEIKSRWNGVTGGNSNNGKLHLSIDEAARLLGMSKSTAHRAQQELMEKGFLARTREGRFYQSRAAEFALTDRGWQDSHGKVMPTKNYLAWRPPKKQTPIEKQTPKKQNIGTLAEREDPPSVLSWDLARKRRSV